MGMNEYFKIFRNGFQGEKAFTKISRAFLETPATEVFKNVATEKAFKYFRFSSKKILKSFDARALFFL
jgi:hypothetical protein